MNKLLLVFFLSISFLVSAQDQRLSGQVSSASDPGGLPGVNVVLKGTTRGSITDLEGRYELEVPAGSSILFSFIGYKSQEISFAGQTSINIVLEEEPRELSEVIVVGYSSVEKRNITGAVTTVKASNFKDFSINGIDQALQGQAPGVQVTQSSGTPGGGVQVRIRGATSIGASNTPLYIVDGVQVETGSLSGRGFGGQNDNALALINPNDIESITVLKDASAKAVYGSRASNGVVVITTRRGKNSPARINFDVQRGIIDPTHRLDLLDATELLTLQREAMRNAGQDPDPAGLIPGITDGINTNWQEEVLRTGILQQYQLSVTGGENNSRFYISGNFREEEGVQLNNKFQRLNGTFNFDHQLTQKLSFGTNMILSRGFNKRVKGDNFLDGVYSGAIRSLPYFTPVDENGALVGPGSPLYAAFPNFNPVAQALLPRFDVLSVKILGGINATYQINENFKLKGQVSLDFNDVTEDNYESSQTAIGGYLPSVGGQGLSIFIANTFTTIVSYGTLSYNKTFGKHAVSALAGTEVMQNLGNGGNVSGRLFASDDFSYIQSAGLVDEGSSYKSPRQGIVSYFGEVRYDMNDRFLLAATFRADGSSKFGDNYKFGYFPGFSAGWRISQEGFFKSNVINDLKLRASFGYTGNERIPSFSYLGLWGTTTYSGSSGTAPSSLDNPNVHWERTREINSGVDFSLWESRIQSSIDVYYNKTFEALLTQPYPFTTGFGGVTGNIGQISNKGIELSLTTVNLDGQLKWRTSLNLSKNLNQVVQLTDSLPLYRGYTGESVDGTNIVRKGEPLGSFNGLNYLGVNPATGDAMYEDRNGDGTINNADAMVIGNAQPDFIGGLTNTLSYRNFDLSIFFNCSVGNKVLNFTKAGLVNMGTDLQSNQLREALRRWQKPGDITDIPRYELGNTNNNLHSNRLLEDASYLRLKNLSMGYNLPQRITSRFMVDQLRIYLSATNLWTLTKYSGSDPEVSTLDGSTTAQGIDFYTLPQVRTISIGLNATLK